MALGYLSTEFLADLFAVDFKYETSPSLVQ